jgi:MtaA/CmuA family methyltransferase
MAYAGILEDVKKAIRLEKPNRLPVFANSEEFDVRMAGEIYNIYNRDAKVMAKTQIESIKKYNYDWAWLQVDDCIEFEILGVGVKGEGNILPATYAYLPAKEETLRSLKMPDPQKDGRMPVMLEAIKRIKEELGDTVCITGRVAAPFSSVSLLYGMTETAMLMFDNPDLLQETNKFFIEFQTIWGVAQLKAGADALWVGDCNASGHLISVDQYREFALDGAKAIADAYREEGGISIYHASEHKIPHMEAQIETGIDVLSCGPGVDIKDVKEAVGNKICLTGNIDPIICLLEKDADAVYKEAKRVAETGAKGGGYMFNSGEMIPRDVPEENIFAMMRGARDAVF